MITADSSDPHLLQAIAEGAQGYIEKPFTLGQIQARVTTLLSGTAASSLSSTLRGHADPRRCVITARTDVRDEWLRQMDDVVEEVFQTMLAQRCAAMERDLSLPADIFAEITLSGALDAICVVEFPARSAEQLTSAFLGSGETGWDDAMIADAVGELCNMIAGGWKKRLGEAAWAAELSTPFICRNCVHRSECRLQDERMRVCRAYAFGESTFAVCLAAL